MTMHNLRNVCSSIMLGMASSVADDIIMRMGLRTRESRETREWRHNENDIRMIIAGLWRYGDWGGGHGLLCSSVSEMV